MPRKDRFWYPGATYHVMARGNHRHEIYRDEEDRIFYKTVIKQVLNIYPFDLHSYCLMSNHVHLQIETKDVNIGKIIGRIHMLYAQYFNKKYKFIGHLFQGRYRSELIETDKYFLETSRYIHLNPVRAGMVENSIDYPWSSYIAYVLNTQDALVTKSKILNLFHKNNPELYRKYVESRG